MSLSKQKVSITAPPERPYSDSRLLKKSTALVPLPSGGHLAPLQRRSVSAGALTSYSKKGDGSRGQVALWPAMAAQKKSEPLGTRSTSKAPLALQLEGFIRKEHRQYLSEHPRCTRADTLHIFREAFGAFVQHFPEYTSVLNVIRDEYDSTIEEMKEQVKQMRVIDLENKSDRSVHAMELMQLKESLTAVISNQQAQMQASQGLVYSLRDQLAAAEHANNLLKFELERNMKEYDDAKDKVKLVSQAMIAESARTATMMETSKKKDKEMDLLNARVQVLTKSVNEMEECLLQRTRQDVERANVQVEGGGATGGASRPTDSTAPRADGAPSGGTASSPLGEDYVVRLQARIDALEFEVASFHQRTPAEKEIKTNCIRRTDAPSSRRALEQSVEVQFPIIREWLRSEGVAEDDLEEGDSLLPPGLWPSEEFAFLKATQPVHNRHLSKRDVISLVVKFWDDRERQVSGGARTQQFFLEWLTKQSANAQVAKELGLNMLMGCARYMDDPACRTLLYALRGFMPESVVPASRRLIRQLTKLCETSTALNNEDTMSFETFFGLVRTVYPEKSTSDMLQLRFFAFRQSRETVHVSTMLDPDSHFVRLLKEQFCREVERFTLAVVEGIREIADIGGNSVTIAHAMKVIHNLDPGMSQANLHGLMAEACQRSVVDIATSGDNITVRLETLLTRFRTVVLLRRASPADLP